MRVYKSQTGFSHILLILLIVLFAMIGFTGWKVYDTSKSVKPAKLGTIAPIINKQEPEIPESFAEYKSEELGFKFTYPQKWGDVNVLELGANANCRQAIKDTEAVVTGAFYELTFTNEVEKMVRVGTKDFNVDIFVPCIGLAAGLKPSFGDNQKEFTVDGDVKYVASTDLYECSLSQYFVAAYKSLPTAKINGLVVIVQSETSNQECDINGIDVEPNLKEIQSQLTQQDKDFVGTFRAL